MPTLPIQLDSPEAIDGRQIRAAAFQKVRLEYVQRMLTRFRCPCTGPALVVGSGRGDLASGLADRGFDVTAVDPSRAATELARSRTGGAPIRLVTAPAEHLGLPDAAFDLAYYADTFEIVPDLGRVLAEAARVLRPGGVLIYDTVNRTPVSRLIYLGVFQGFPATRIMPPGRYAGSRLRRPREVSELLAANGLAGEDVCAFQPRSALALIKAVLARRRGRITEDQISGMVDFTLTPGHHPLVTYLGVARKR